MKKLIALMVVCSSFMFGISSSSAAPVVIKISNPVTENSTWYKGLLKFKEIIEEKTSGKYEVQIYNSDQLTAGNQTQALEMIQMGATDFDCRGMVIHTVLDDRFTVVNMPFILPDLETVDKILSGSGKEALFQFASENGLHPLALGESGYRQITSGPKAIRVPADMKNLKVRIPSMPMFFDLFEILGANPTTINMSEVFTALQQGVIDAHENPLDVSRSYKINEVQKYITLWNAVYDPILFCCSEQFWARLSDEEKTLFQNASDEAMNYQKQLVRSENDSILKLFSETMEIIRPTEEEMAQWKAAVQPVYEKWYGKIDPKIWAAFGYTKK